MTVCTDVPYEPFDYVEDGEFTGFDLDLMRAVAEGMDLELEVKDMSFDGIQSGAALQAGQCDIAAAAMTITEDRKKNLAFTQPYYDSMQSLLVPSDSDIASIEDTAEVKIGVQQGTTGEAYARENTPEGTELVSFDGEATLYQSLEAGGVAGVLQDLPVNLRHTEGDKYTIVEEFDTGEQYGFAVKKEGSEALLQAVNDQLDTLREDGSYDELYDKYFDTES